MSRAQRKERQLRKLKRKTDVKIPKRRQTKINKTVKMTEERIEIDAALSEKRDAKGENLVVLKRRKKEKKRRNRKRKKERKVIQILK